MWPKLCNILEPLLSTSKRLQRFSKIAMVSSYSTATTATTATSNVLDKKLEYYNKIGSIPSDVREPEDWATALPFEKIPGPKPAPIIGNIWRFVTPMGDFHKLDLQQIHRHLHNKYGDTVKLQITPFTPPFIFLFNPDDCEKVFRNEGSWPVRYGIPSFTYYRNEVRKDVFQGVGGSLTVQGKDWFNFRSTVNPIVLQPRIVQRYVSTMDAIANEFVDNIRYFASVSESHQMPDDFQSEINKWALESIAVITLDKHLGCLRRDLPKDGNTLRIIKSVLQMFDLMYQLDVLPSLWRHISTPAWKKYVKVMDFLTDTITKNINEAMIKFENAHNAVGNNSSEQSVLEKLLQKDKKIAIAMASDMMTAGVDTTSRVVAASLYYLAKHPEKQQLLRDEAIQHLPKQDSPVTKAILDNTPYLKAVIKEVTRLAPIAIGNLRTTVQDSVVGGYQIPKGTEVLSSNLIMCTMDEHFPKPKEFIPERWLRTTVGELSYKNTHPLVFLPFGFGPRSCIGKRIANLEMEVLLLKIIRNFKLEWPHEDMVFKTMFLHGMVKPLNLVVEPLPS